MLIAVHTHICSIYNHARTRGTALFLFELLIGLAASIFISSQCFATPLSITVVVIANNKELFTSWDKPIGKPFAVVPIKVAQRGAFLSAVVLFKDCQPDASGNCNVEMDMTTYDPKGIPYGSMQKVELWQAKPAPDAGFTQLSRSYMGIVVENTDLSGVYTVAAIASDLNANKKARSKTIFTVK